ncbi:lachesin-like isoform X3 [Venturia canescens]|uniref:lachesin-like isoform X3 n=1 Tax=Venturia canescens TaxID=32260 RepID=UPI001C9CD5CC|nr:lachesin-like isoform X3 [Venturia canescens]
MHMYGEERGNEKPRIFYRSVAWLRAEDQTVLSIGQRTISHSNRFTVTVENVTSKNQSFNNNNNNNNNEHQDTSTMTDETTTWRLHIRSLKEADRGCYMCQVNTRPMLSQLGCVDVLVAPDILVDGTSEGEVSIMEGENATLTCKASGRPLPQVYWRTEKNHFILTRGFRDELVQVYNATGERLELTRVDRRQTGAYLCIAKNEVPPAISKRVYLRVNFAPSAKVRNELLNSPLNTNVSLICEIEASPKTINLWTKRRDQVIMSGGRYVIDERTNPDDEWKTTIELKIKNLQKSDLGEYNCSATSSMGYAESILGLYERQQDTTTSRPVIWTSSRKSNRERSSYLTTPRYNHHRPSTPMIGQRTTSLLTSKKKYFFSTTSTSTLTPRVILNKDKNALKHNEVLNIRNIGISIVNERIQILLPTVYLLVIFSMV